GAAVGQRLAQQPPVPEMVAEPLLQLAQIGLHAGGTSARAHSIRWNNRRNRIASGHFQTSHTRALPLVEKKMISARPIRFSTGMNPTLGTRLSSELSRLSPMANTWPSGTT